MAQILPEGQIPLYAGPGSTENFGFELEFFLSSSWRGSRRREVRTFGVLLNSSLALKRPSPVAEEEKLICLAPSKTLSWCISSPLVSKVTTRDVLLL